jgi:hypothetical protein
LANTYQAAGTISIGLTIVPVGEEIRNRWENSPREKLGSPGFNMLEPPYLA